MISQMGISQDSLFSISADLRKVFQQKVFNNKIKLDQSRKLKSSNDLVTLTKNSRYRVPQQAAMDIARSQVKGRC